MFTQFRNIEKAFRHIRLFSLIFLAVTFLGNVYGIYKSNQTVQQSHGKVYVLDNGHLKEAVSADRADYLDIEVEDHVANFHSAFYGLEPDDEFIKQNVTRALYLADESAKTEYGNLKEAGYYSDIIAGNISQRVLKPDSIKVSIAGEAISFHYYGKLKIIRATTTVIRNLITEGTVRISNISRNNPHGLLIERWKVLDNADLSIEKR